jgi:hypothetical protein
MVSGGIIALSQVADALRDVFPFTARREAANDLVTSLEVLLIEVLYEAEGVYAGWFTNEDITDRRRKLMNLRHDADVKHFPTGNLPEREDLLALADEAAIAYFEAIFGPRINPSRKPETAFSRVPGWALRSRLALPRRVWMCMRRREFMEGARAGARIRSGTGRALPATTKMSQGWTLIRPAGPKY